MQNNVIIMTTPWKFSSIWTQNLGVMTSPTIQVNASKQQTLHSAVIATNTPCYIELYGQGTLRAFTTVIVGCTHNFCVMCMSVLCQSVSVCLLRVLTWVLTCWICHSSEVLGSNCTKFSGSAHNHNNYYVIGPFLHGLICRLRGGGVACWIGAVRKKGRANFLPFKKGPIRY